MGDQTAVVLPVFVINLLTCYSLLVAYALMGYLLYQYAGELGFAERQQRGRSLPPEEYQRKAALGQSHIYARRGRLKDALGVINRALAAQSTNIRLHEHKHRLLMSLKRPAKLTAHASEYVRILVAAGNPGNATAVLKNVWQQEPDFRLDDPSAALAIARVFHQQQQFREARRMLANLHRDHPEFEQLGEAYLLLARVYLEGYDSRDHVTRILGFLRKNRPQMLDSEDGHYLRRMVAD